MDENDIINSSKAMQKMREIAERLYKDNPKVYMDYPMDSILRSRDKDGPANKDAVAHNVNLRPQNLTDNSGIHSVSNQVGLSAHLNAGININFKEELTPNEIQKNYQDYLKIYGGLQDNFLELEQEKERISKSFIKSEQEYRQKIESLTTQLRPNFQVTPGEKKNLDDISSTHDQILDKISLVQIRTSKILLDQERDIIHFYNSKINELREQFEEENEKQAKRDQDF